MNKFFTPIWNNLKSWATEYTILPLTILSIIGASYLTQFLTKRPPAENLDWLTDYSSLSMKCALIIVFTSAMKQCTGSWMTTEQKIAHPYLATIGDIKTIITFCVFAWLFGR